MFEKIIEKNRPHHAAIAHLSTRDIPLQISTAIVLGAICIHLGHIPVGIGVAVGAIVSETMIILLVNRSGPFSHLSRSYALLLVFLLSSANMFLYILPALYFAAEPSLAMKITGILWVMGLQVYIANSWSRVPVFLYGMLVPAMLMMVVTFFELPTSAPMQSPLSHWAITFAFVVLFIYSSIETLRQHMTNEVALIDAERVAATRLSQLEDSHRRDSLTGLLNRPAFDVALDVMLQDRSALGGEIAVFLVDLDSFKAINDTYSHAAGDVVLIETARRLHKAIADMGLVGRMGGDEFICAVQDITGPDDAIELANTLATLIARSTPWNQRMLRVTASIGIAMTGDGPSAPRLTVAALCSAADQAMFAAKTSPNRRPTLYQSDLFEPHMTPDDKQILVDGIADGSIRPFYQPKIHLPTGKVTGFEALARWNHPVEGAQSPAKFLYQINDLGLQGDFMTSMATKVFRDVEAMLAKGLNPGQVSLNVPEVALATHSGRQDLKRIITDNPNAAKHMTFEITEDVFIARAADTIQASIATFRDLGVRISLDDFGTGFASFHHLRALDFDELKIDTSFVADLGQDATSDVLVKGFFTIASGLGVSVVAEGVETELQRNELLALGCQTAQGYLFSPAIPLDQAMDLLSDKKPN